MEHTRRAALTCFARTLNVDEHRVAVVQRLVSERTIVQTLGYACRAREGPESS